MRTNSKVVLVTLGLGGVIYLGRQCWRKAKRGPSRLPSDRGSQGQPITEECTQASEPTETTPTTPLIETVGTTPQETNDCVRITPKDAWKYLRSAVLDLADVSFCGFLSYRLLIRICVTRIGVGCVREESLLNIVLDNSLVFVTVYGLSLFLGGKIIRKYCGWKDRFNGTPASPPPILIESRQLLPGRAEAVGNPTSGSRPGQRVMDGIWNKVKASCAAVLDHLDFWTKFAIVEQVVSLNKVLLKLNCKNNELNDKNSQLIHNRDEIIKAKDELIELLEGNLRTFQENLQVLSAGFARQQTELARQRAATDQIARENTEDLETARTRVYEQDRQESLTAYQ